MAYPPPTSPTPMTYPPQKPPQTPAGPPPGTMPLQANRSSYPGRSTVVIEGIDQKNQDSPSDSQYPCGCPYPSTHNSDCMWHMWELMRDNYIQTKMLMNQFMSQMSTEKPEQPITDQGCCQMCRETSNRPQISLPWLQSFGPSYGSLGLPGSLVPGNPEVDKSENTKLVEEQRQIKSIWAQFLNIFDMALDLANDVAKDRKEAIKLRKEKERLEKEQRLEEIRKERRQRRSVGPSKTKSEDKPPGPPKTKSEEKPTKHESSKKKQDKKDSVKSTAKQSTDENKSPDKEIRRSTQENKDSSEEDREEIAAPTTEDEDVNETKTNEDQAEDETQEQTEEQPPPA